MCVLVWCLGQGAPMAGCWATKTEGLAEEYHAAHLTMAPP